MLLGFMQRFPWKVNGEPEPTHFRERILAGAGYYLDPSLPQFKEKVHTFRLDPHGRWKADRKIEMVYRGAGYKILDHFNKGISELEKCVSTQKIEITDPWDLGTSGFIKIDGRIIEDPQEYMTIAQNDGFKDVFHFTKWFKKPFSGKIIHWSDLRY